MYYVTNKRYNQFQGVIEWYYVYVHTNKSIYFRYNNSTTISNLGLFGSFRKHQIMSDIVRRVTKEEFEGDCPLREMPSYNRYRKTIRKIRLSNEYRHYSRAVITLSRM